MPLDQIPQLYIKLNFEESRNSKLIQVFVIFELAKK